MTGPSPRDAEYIAVSKGLRATESVRVGDVDSEVRKARDREQKFLFLGLLGLLKWTAASTQSNVWST